MLIAHRFFLTRRLFRSGRWGYTFQERYVYIAVAVIQKSQRFCRQGSVCSLNSNRNFEHDQLVPLRVLPRGQFPSLFEDFVFKFDQVPGGEPSWRTPPTTSVSDARHKQRGVRHAILG